MDLFDLAAKITLDTSEYEEGLNKSEKSASSFGNRLKRAFKVGAAAIGTVTVATGAMATAVVNATGNVAKYGDNIDKMSQKMGLSAEAYQEWDAIMQHSGTSIESLQAGMKTLANAVENGNDAFERLGISQEEIASMNNEQLFSATITALQNVENETERTYLAGQLLGRGATELGALLNTSAEDTEAMRKRVHELGGVMSNEAVKAAAAYQDSLQDMKTAFSGLSRGLVSQFLPSITTVMDGLTEIFSGNSDAGIGMISDGIDQLVDGITDKLPMVVDVAIGILKALATALIKNVPKIAKAAIDIMMALGQFFVENLPMLVDVSLEMLLTLANALIENVPTLIPAIVNVVTAIATKLTEPEMLTMLIDAAIQLAFAIMDGLLDSIPQLVEAMFTIIGNLSQAIIDNIPKVMEAVGKLIGEVFTVWITLGTELVKPFATAWESIKQVFAPVGEFFAGIWESIKGAFSSVTSWLGNTFSEAWQAVKNVFTTGGEIFEGIVGGIADTFKSVVNHIIDGINTVISIPFNQINGFLNTLRNVNILGVTPFSWIRNFSVPQIPKLAKGGIVDDATLALIGEGQSSEAVVPLDAMWKEMRSMFAENGGGRRIESMTVNVYAAEGQDPKEIAQAVMEEIQADVERKAAVFA